MPNNRELATLILFAVLLVWALSMEKTRGSVVAVIRAAFVFRLSVLWGSYVVALGLGVWGLRSLGLRYDGSVKDAVVWAVVVGLPILTKFDHASKHPGSFAALLRTAVTATAFVEFYINLYVFPLWAELLLQPFLALLAMLAVVAGTRDEWAVTKRLVDGCMTLIGWSVFAAVTVYLVSNLAALDGVQIGLSLVQPLVLTAVVVALTYLFALYSSYEHVFMRMKFPIVPTPTSRWSKVALVRGLHFRVHKVAGFTGNLPRRLKSRPAYSDALRLVQDYKHGRTGPGDSAEV